MYLVLIEMHLVYGKVRTPPYCKVSHVCRATMLRPVTPYISKKWLGKVADAITRERIVNPF